MFVLIAIGVVQIVRVQWFDAAVFFAAGFAVTADVLRAHPHGTRRRGARRAARPAVGILWLSLGAGLGGAVMCFVPRHGIAMKVAVITVGAAAAGLAWLGTAIARPRAQTALSRGVLRLALAWTLIVVAGCVWELIQFILGLVDPQDTWFALSDLLNPAVATVPGRILFIVGWSALGVWLLRRGGKR